MKKTLPVGSDAFHPNALAAHPVRSQPALADFAPLAADDVYLDTEADDLGAHLCALGIWNNQ